ncbi:MAG: helix-turn-helix domain-containing protein [Micromonosporaceae bacterium]
MAGGAHAVAIRLTTKRRRKLEQIVRAATSPQRLVPRARIVLVAAGGTANAAIARDLGCSVAVVRAWRGRFAVCGIPGLFDKPRSGRRCMAPARGWPWWPPRPRCCRRASRSGHTP